MQLPRRLRLVLSGIGIGLGLGLTAPAQEAAAPACDPPLLGIPRSEYQTRRAELMKRLRDARPSGRPRAGAEPVVVLRAAADPDIEARFRQSHDFAYLTGVDVPDAALVLYPKSDRAVLYLPPTDPHGGTFTMARPGPGPESTERFGFPDIEPTSRLLADLFGAIGDPLASGRGNPRALVYVPGPIDREGDGPDARLARVLRLGAPATELRDLDPTLAAMRKVKSENEIRLLKRAIEATSEAFRAVARELEPGVREYALQGAILGAFGRAGADGPGFPPIVGSGPNATIPHYFGLVRKLQAGDLVVVDIGASCDLYTADITRTYPADGRFTPRQREVYELVLAAQKAVEAEMKPGQTKLNDMTRFVREFFRKSPLRAKDEKGVEHTMDAFFIHGLGHDLGMDVHDVGDMSEPVRVGEVFTIEPGLYIRSESLGVRIEDDYLMTEHGPEKLSAMIPSDPDEVERFLRAAKRAAVEEKP
jgi:Xaa-Pro aminopeptidase